MKKATLKTSLRDLADLKPELSFYKDGEVVFFYFLNYLNHEGKMK